MCGLIGGAGRMTTVHETAVKQLLIVDCLRGMHSVGLARIGSTGDCSVVKRAGMSPQDFLDLRKTADLFAGANRCFIGHNRFATQGAINSANAHPFEFEHVVGAHNGSLLQHSLHKLPGSRDFDVDSEMIFNSINQIGSEETAKILNGAFALTWWDKRDNSLHFMRNDQRPLWYTMTPDEEVIFWASEPWMLHGILGRNSIKYTELKSVPVKKELVFFFKLLGADGKIASVEVDRDFYEPPATTYQSGYNGFKDYDYDYSRRGSLHRGGGMGSVGEPATSSSTSLILKGEEDAKKPYPPTQPVGGTKPRIRLVHSATGAESPSRSSTPTQGKLEA